MSDSMTYKGYIGTVHYSEEDEVFHGKIEAINDLIMFEGTSVKELKKAFHEAVDDYLETCKEMGRDPQKPFKGSFNVRIPSDSAQEGRREGDKDGSIPESTRSEGPGRESSRLSLAPETR